MAFPTSPLPVTAELYLGPTLGWVGLGLDPRAATAGSGGGVTTTRGRQAEGSRTEPGRCTLVLNNRLGKYSPRNPMSDYFGLLGRNTPIRVGVDIASDTFTRTSASGWLTSDSGRVWQHYGATLADFTVTGGLGKHLHPTINLIRGSRLDHDWRDVEQYTEASIPAVATGASIVVGHIARYQVATGEHYWLRMEFDTAGRLSVKISKFVSGAGPGTGHVELAVSSSIAGLTYTAGQAWSFRSSVSGSRLAIKIWQTGTAEPLDWTISAVDTQHAEAGRAGMQTWVVLGNTNVSPEVRFDNYRATLRRFFGEVSSWPQRWDASGNDQWVPVEASGILRRLGGGTSPARSPLRRALAATSPAAYWPGEDGATSNRLASAIGGHPAMTVIGTAEFVPIADFGTTITLRSGSAALVNLAAGAELSAYVPGEVTAATASVWTVHVRADVDPAIISGNFIIAEWTTPGGTYVRWQIVVTATDTRLIGITPVGSSTVLVTGFLAVGLAAYVVTAEQVGGNISINFWQNGATSVAGTVAGVASLASNTTNVTATNRVTVGHFAIWPTASLPYNVNSIETDPYGETINSIGFSARYEAAHLRLARLCAEEGIPLDMPTVSTDGIQRMGWQPVGTFADLVASCVDADGGVLIEARDQLGLVYRPRETLYNQTEPTLSYAGGHIAAPFEPVDDDDSVINDITVTRRDGSSFRAVQTGGSLPALPPPAGPGIYESSVELNLARDDQLDNQAGWRLHLGTVDESRYPRIHVDLTSPAWVADPELTAQVAALDSGDVMAVDDLPAWLPPGPTKVMVQGYTETLDGFDWDITWNASPASPWDIATADGEQRVAADGSTLAAALTAGGTTLTLASTDVNGPWTTDAADCPLDLRVGGERVTASAIAAAAADTFTRTTSNGWGTSDSGQAWTTSGGTAANYSTSGTQGVHSLTTVNVLRECILPVSWDRIDVTLGRAGISAAAAGAPIEQALVVRRVDASNLLDMRLFRNTAGAPSVAIRQIVAGVETVSSFPTITGATSMSAIQLRVQAIGSTLRGKAWIVGDPEPSQWLLEIAVTHLTAGAVALRSLLETGNTNTLPVTADFDDLTVRNPQTVTITARGVNGVNRAWSAGTEVDVWFPAIVGL